MRFHKKFARRVGAVSSDPVLGSDSAPTGAEDITKDNGIGCRMRDHVGFPLRRIAIAYGYDGAGAPLDLGASLFYFDDLTARWFLASTATLAPGEVNYIDAPAVMPALDSAIPGHAGAHVGLDAVLVVSAAGGDPDGVYTFALAGCA